MGSTFLDMHGAPGGQTGQNIDDSEADIPELFTDERNQDILGEDVASAGSPLYK